MKPNNKTEEKKEVVKAIIKGTMIACGKCFHKIAGCNGLKTGLGRGEIYLMCKHKDSGKVCRTINKIEL